MIEGNIFNTELYVPVKYGIKGTSDLPNPLCEPSACKIGPNEGVLLAQPPCHGTIISLLEQSRTDGHLRHLR